MKKNFTLFAAVLFAFTAGAQFEDNITSPGEVYAETNPATTHSYYTNEGRVVEQLNGKTLFEAHLKNRKLNGRWQSWYENGFLCDSGTFAKGLPDGEWKHWDADGNLVALRTYSADRYHRINNELVRYHPKRVSFALAALYRRDKKAALKFMRASYSFNGGQRSRDGLSLAQLASANITAGNFYQPIFDHSLHHGLYINYFADGTAKDSGYYRNGLRQGVWVHFDSPGGVMHRGAYHDGRKVKDWKTYNHAGKLMAIRHYSASGRLTWQRTM